jgi:group II intron reverse transcriptase/maturase
MREDPANKAKPFEIPKRWVWESYQQVRSKGGSPGCDGQSIEGFEAKLRDNLYKLWNRMSSGSYLPPPVKSVEIPKPGGGVRTLGIPTVADRVAQGVAKRALEPELERHFHADSYGYRPGKSALDAVSKTRERCWRYDWVVDLDIQAFFDSIDHDLLIQALRRHTQERWILLYVQRWLKADSVLPDGQRVARERGTPQGGVISPLLANLFLHYVFDTWMSRHWSDVPFARYADDAVCHCRTEAEARRLVEALRERFADCGLCLHPEKTRIVYCRDDRRRREYPETSFDFLGYTFCGRTARDRQGTLFVGFNPAVSRKALAAMSARIRGWCLHRRVGNTLEDLAEAINPVLRGWLAYYGRFSVGEFLVVFRLLERRLARWACRKYKGLQRSLRCSQQFIRRIRMAAPQLFVHWHALSRGSMV